MVARNLTHGDRHKARVRLCVSLCFYDVDSHAYEISFISLFYVSGCKLMRMRVKVNVYVYIAKIEIK